MPKPYQSRAEYYYGALTEGYDGELPKPQSREDYYLLRLIEQMGNISSKSVMTPKGSITFATLPSPDSAELGDYYNVSDSFTTTSDFIEGAGHRNEAGTNVGLVLDSNGNKKWDCFGMNFTVTDKLYSKQNYHDPMSPYALLNAYGTTGLIIPGSYGFTQGVANDIKMPGTVWIGAEFLDEGSVGIMNNNINSSFIFSPESSFGFYKNKDETDPSENKHVVDSSIFIGNSMQAYVGTGKISEVTAVGCRIRVGDANGAVLVGFNIDAIGCLAGTMAFGSNILAGSDGFSGENVDAYHACFYGTNNDVVYLDAPWTKATGAPLVVVGSGGESRISALEIGPTGISVDSALLPEGKDTVGSYRLGLYEKSMTLSDGTEKKRYVLGAEKYTMFSNVRIMTADDPVPKPPQSRMDGCSICVWPYGVVATGHPDGPIYDKDGTETFYHNGCCRILYPLSNESGSFDNENYTFTAGFLFNSWAGSSSNASMYIASGNPGFIRYTRLTDPSTGNVVTQKLTPGAKINGVLFDGSSDISIPIGLTKVNGMTFTLEKRRTSLVPNTAYASEIKVSRIELCGYPHQPDSKMTDQNLLKKEIDIHTISATFANGVILGYTGFYWWDSKTHLKYVKSINAPSKDDYVDYFNTILHAPSTTKTVPCSCEHGYAGMVILAPNNLGKAAPTQCTITFYPSDSFVPGDTIHCEFLDIETDIATETDEPYADAPIVR